MGCSRCGQNSSTPKSFRHTAPDGTITIYRTEIEARAAKIRQGGDYVAVSG